MIKPGDLVFTESPSYDRRSASFVATAPVVGIRWSRMARHRCARERAEEGRPEVLLSDPGLPEPCRSDVFRYQAPSDRGAGRKVQRAARRGRAVPVAAVSRDRGATLRLAPERTLHMSSFTKLIAPGVRCGFMLGDAAILGKLAKVAEDTYISPGYVAQAITYEWCRRGLLPRRSSVSRSCTRRVWTRVCRHRDYMPDARATKPDGGFFISLALPEGVSTTAVRAQPTRRG